MTGQTKPFPSAPQALLLIVAMTVAEILVGTLLREAGGVLALTVPQIWTLTSLIVNGCVFATIMQRQGLSYRQLFHPAGTSMRATAASVVPWVLLLVPALVIGLSMLVTLLTQAIPLSDKERALFDSMAGNDFATLLLACVIAPVVEEMLFRGIILRGFLQRHTRAQAIWASSVLFGLAHMNIYQFVAALLMGAASGWLYTRARSLVPCIALHAAYNGALNLLASLGSGSDDSTQITLTGGLWIASMLLAAVGVLFLMRTFDEQDSREKP
ncbi:MAG: CPBP family intramembrane glutamic endopeptidase [Burkholderiaceae bacterium]